MPARAPIRLVPVPGVRLPWGDVVVPVVPASASSGAFCCVHVTAAAGARRPTYVDHAADELVHVLSGSFAVVTSGDERIVLGPGAGLCVPRGMPRRLESEDGRGGSLLVMATPGDVAHELLAAWGRLPAAADGPVHPAGVDLARYGIEVVRSAGG